jgi:hypothetical protein
MQSFTQVARRQKGIPPITAIQKQNIRLASELPMLEAVVQDMGTRNAALASTLLP